MRSLVPRLLLALALAVPSLSQSPKEAQIANEPADVLGRKTEPMATSPTPTAGNAPDAGAAAGATNSEAISGKDTFFNGIAVPRMKELSAKTWDEETKDGYWLVKHYSPYCQHCIDFAPTWQTIYEFYYTSQPVSGSSKSSELNDFHRYYNFNFASMDCIVSADFCQSEEHNVNAWPTMVLYKGGKEIKRYTGYKTVEGMSGFIEEALESIKPGSRPKRGKMILPTARATAVAGTPIETAVALVSSAKGKNVAKSTATPNPMGTSISLDAESFQKLVTKSQEPWFIEFFAPWCHHCQALAPNWHQMSRELQGKLNVGQVNCETEKRLCKDVRVKAYPTIHFFRGGERVEYNGLRGLGDLVSYAKKAVDIGMGVDYVDAESFKRLEETEDVIFVYFYDHATTSEDFAALDRLTLSLIGHAKLVKTDSVLLADRFKIHTWPKLLVSRNGRPNYFNALAPKDMRDFRQVLGWMQRVWLPLVPELTATNAKEVMHGHLVVLGVLSRDSDEFALNKKEMKNAAVEWMDRELHAFQLDRQEQRDSKQLRIEEAEDRSDQRALRDAKGWRIEIAEENRRQVRFAWVDGVFWERWLRTTYGVQITGLGEGGERGVRVIVTDEDSKRYWDTTISGEPIRPSRTSILETLKYITLDTPKIKHKYTTSYLGHVFFKIKSAGWNHPWLSSCLMLVAIVGTAVWGKGRIRRSRGAGLSGVGGGWISLGEKDDGGAGKSD